MTVLGTPSSFHRDAYRDAFVNAAFPAIFWSAARCWSDRRLAGWLWYLGMPLDLYAPLARIARQYDDPEPFHRSAARLLAQTDAEDKDVFLGLFPDILGAWDIYADCFGAFPPASGAVADYPVHPAFHRVASRRSVRRTRLHRALIDLIQAAGDAARLEAAERALRKLAPPFIDPPSGVVAPKRKAGRRRPLAREKDRPPETLP